MLVVPWLIAVLAQATEAAPMEVAGRVVDAKRQPVAGAELWLIAEFGPGFERGAKPRAVSGAQGRFRFSEPAPGDAQGAELPWAIVAAHAKHGLGAFSFTQLSL